MNAINTKLTTERTNKRTSERNK